MPNRVVSKYFSTNIETGMDDSLSDFQEKKKYNIGPKNVKKTRNNKKLKRTRGQKDIRVLINKQGSDVLSYSKDFDKVCRQTGVDIDSEELQLAIALSKSHNEVNKELSSVTETLKTAQYLTSQERTLRIKTTLQEYGFRVPKTKITDSNKRKKCRKQYKLLLISDAERQQIISDKYSEVLAGNIYTSPAKVLECNYNDRELYYKSTNIAYDNIKNDNVYYVKDLFNKPGQKTCLLKDWSEIPGRPLSPTVEVNNINFDDIIFEQHDLDCLLSGSIFTAQQIITNKNADITYSKSITIGTNIHSRQDEPEPFENQVRHKDDSVSGIQLFKKTECYMNSNTMFVSQVRCISPDLFDDEPSTVMECTNIDVQDSAPIVLMTDNDNVHTYCMDLTDCVNVNSYNLNPKIKPHSNEINITNRKSNDFMEITKCVSTSSKQVSVENIDLTQNSFVSNNQCSTVLSQKENTEVMDLTQVSDYGALKACQTKKKMLNDRIILVDDDFNFKQHQLKQNFTLREMPEPIFIDDMVFCEKKSDKGDCNEKPNFINDYKTKENEENSLNRFCKSVETLTSNGETNLKKSLDILEINFSTEKCKDQNYQSTTNSFTDHVGSNSYENNWKYESHSCKKIIDESGEHTNELVVCQPDEIDLTQSSNSSNGETITYQPISNYSTSLGKRDNTSIDYDEIDNDIVKESYSQTTLKLESHILERDSTEQKTNMSNTDILSNPIKNSEEFKFLYSKFNYSLDQSKHDNFNNEDITNRVDENSFSEKEHNSSNNDIDPSKSFEVFEICDKELNYSSHQSKQNFDLPNLQISEGACNCAIINRSLSEKNELCSYTVKKSLMFNLNSETSTPLKLPYENVKNVVQTPKNGEYIIKTNEVTPMLDYALMSSPERHKELEKYGLKPFKRKRAIQLLTYLYNQTHPVVESHKEDCLSTPKRQKKEDGDEINKLPYKPSKSVPLESIIMTSKAPQKDLMPEMNKENDLYAVTNEQPEMRNIECEANEWVFQKREKAKLQSCRVPLHVAFHNYVTCRRRLREAILRYEPVSIDVIHKDLIATGYRYHPKDLLKFMDRKCITVKTADNNSRNRKS